MTPNNQSTPGLVAFSPPNPNNDTQRLLEVARLEFPDEPPVRADMAVVAHPNNAGAILAVKLRMSPERHDPPATIMIPVYVLPEGAAIFDRNNSKLVWAELNVENLHLKDTPASA